MTSFRLAEVLAGQAEMAANWQPLLDEFVGGLRVLGIGVTAPRVGERFPDFALPDSRGRTRSLGELIADGPLVLSFNRGGFCPYCRHELEAWNGELQQLAELGGSFAALTGEIGGRAAALGEIFSGDATLLCDVDHGVALATGLAFHLGRPMLERYKSVGLDLADLYGSAGGFLPVPATFVIDTAGIVRFAFVDVDFRLRAEPGDVLQAMRDLL